MSEETVRMLAVVAMLWVLAIGTVAIGYGLVTDIRDREDDE